jgi:hypothetical protein
VMSNHYRIVLRMDSANISDEEVVDRWLKLCLAEALPGPQG